jgi:hypothetical protein
VVTGDGFADVHAVERRQLVDLAGHVTPITVGGEAAPLTGTRYALGETGIRRLFA